jgi:photosynthetic reaction center cytochrome c subunit
MLKRLVFTGAIAWLIAFATSEIYRHSSAASAQQRNQKSWMNMAFPFESVAFAQNRPILSEAAFKNIQVLKGIPVDEFMGTMGLFSAALNVCCGDCHVGAGGDNPQWDADTIPRKRTARRMVTMVNNINRDNFGGAQVVTCWTCHRGNSNPATTPPLDSIYGDAVVVPPDVLPQATANSGAPSVDQVFDKYIQALGGAARVAALTSYTSKGTSHLFGETQNDPAEVYAKAPSLLATFIHQRGGDLARTWDGRDAWVMLPLTVVGEYQLNAGALEGAKLDAQMAFPGGLKQFFKTWRVGFPTTLEGREVNILQGTAPGLLGTFYFDKQTGLLTRMVRMATSAVGRVPTQVDYSDYRPVAGVMMPFKWTYAWVSGREEYEMKEIQPNVPVDTAKFAKPVQRPK